MGLLINQGKQDTSGDILAPIVEQNAQLVVHSLAIPKGKAGILEVCFRILTGPNKNRLVFDRVTYDAKDKMSYKYRQLRAACGVPYSSDEPEQIDIEDLLLNRPLVADLGIREYDKDGQTRKAQSIKYHRDGETESAQPSVDELPVIAEPVKKPNNHAKAKPIPEKPAAKEPVIEAEAVEEVAEAVEDLAYGWE